MRASLRRRVAMIIGVATLAASVAVVAAPSVALAADVIINVPTTFAAADASDGASDGTFTVTGNLTITSAGAVTCNDPASPPNADACDIDIAVSGDMVMQAGSAILAENNVRGGSGGDITIDVDGDMTMCAAAGAQTGCGGATANPGAVISARKTSGAGDTGTGGNIVITVGDLSTATGAFYMEGGTTGYGTESGAKILATGPGAAGDITITVGDTYFTEPGAVIEAGGPATPGTTIQRGGKIYIVVGCELTTEGRITSKGDDPGADLVHLEGCEVVVHGLVESTGKGHTVNANPNQNDVQPANSCDGYTDSLPGEIVHADKPGNATACIEVWGKVITIDSTGSQAGELNADIGNGGTKGSSWIDIYAFSSLVVDDGAGNDELRNNNSGTTYLSTYAVHANTIGGSDKTPNTIIAKVAEGPLTASGKAFESSATLTGGTGVNALASDTGHAPGPYFVGNGSTGGTIDVEASDLVDLDDAWVNASGDFYGGAACPSGSGTCGSGGHIIVHSWDDDIDWREVSGDVRPNDSGGNGAGGTTNGGDIVLDACGTLDTTGTDFHGETPSTPSNCDASKPALPSYVSAAFTADAPIWALCGASTIGGTKFEDEDGSGSWDPGEPGLDGWTIHLFNASGSVHMTATTSGGGAYTFTGVPPGTYTVCEELQSGWTETFPTSGADCVTPGDPAADNSTPGPIGYTVDLSASCCSGQQVTGLDFGNHSEPVSDQPECQKQTVIDAMNLTYPGNSGPDTTVRTWLGESVQDAVDAASDTNFDGYIIVMVIAHADGSLGGTANQKVVVDKDYGNDEPFALFGCSVTLTGGGTDPAVWVKSSANSENITVNGRTTDIFVMDLHGGDSAVGVQADGSYRYLRNEDATGNETGIRVVGDDNTIHNGAATDNTGDGVYVSGNDNKLTDVDAMDNDGHGFNVAGNGNELLKLDAGDRGSPNGLDGVHVVGDGNTLSEIDAYASGGDGIDVAGSNNTLTKNTSGDRTKGNAGDGILIVGGSNTLTENEASANGGDGFDVSGGGNEASANKLKDNESNTGSSGSDLENAGAEWRFLDWIKNNGGGNEADGVLLADGVKGLTNFPASGSSFNYTAVQTAE